MPKIRFFREGVECEAEPGANLRELALRHGVQLYRSFHVPLNCRGKGKCGSCRVEVSDPAAVVPVERTPSEVQHLAVAFSDATTRLACQVGVNGDLSVLTQPVKTKKIEGKGFIPRGF